MLKTLKTVAALAFALVLAIPMTATADTGRAVITNLSTNGSNINILGQYWDGSSFITNLGTGFSGAGITTNKQYFDAAAAAVVADATGQELSIAGGVVWPFLSADEIQTLINTSFASSTNQADWAQANSSHPGFIKNKPSITSVDAMSFANPSRSLNSAFQVSSTRASYVNYSVDIATTVSLAGGQVGTVFLEYADDSGFTTNVKEVGRFVNGQTGTLVVGLTLNQTNTAQVQGMIPAGKYVRLRTANTTGSPTFTFRSAQEVLLPSN